MVMVLLLLANATYVQVINANAYRSDPRNLRTLLAEYSRQRGQITAGGQQLATVEETNERLKFLRKYPNGPVYAPATGYFSVAYPPTGVENTENQVLDGSDSRLFGPRLSDLITGRNPRGGNVALTLNPAVQQAAYDAMTAPNKNFTGSVVALNPKTGEILGMVSTPSFDPNRLASHDTAAEQKAYAEYQADPAHPMLNRAIKETYPPGSTFKLVVAASALENGYNKDSQLTAAPSITLPGTNTGLTNFASTPCPGTSMEEALAHSCNTAFAELAGQLGADKLRAEAAKFGIGQQDLHVPMQVQPSQVGPMPDQASVYQSGIGQRDVLLTPLQNAMVAATIANGGVRMDPYLVKSILAPDLSTLDQTSPKIAGRAMTPAAASTLRDMMIKSEQFTGGAGKLANVTIASKTGTAEHGTDPKNTPPHAWYVAFAPAQDPKIAVAVVVENGGDRGLAAVGGTVAAPIGRAVIGAALGGGGG
jgi:peptidoglycan glycosyltransferase